MRARGCPHDMKRWTRRIRRIEMDGLNGCAKVEVRKRTYTSRHEKKPHEPTPVKNTMSTQLHFSHILNHAPLFIPINDTWCDTSHIGTCADKQENDANKRFKVE